MHQLPDVLLGAALVAMGVLAAAIADRIRGLHLTRERASHHLAGSSSKPRAPRRDTTTTADDASGAVIGALVTAGYNKRVAVAATAGCAPDQRATVESWTRGALRLAGKEA